MQAVLATTSTCSYIVLTGVPFGKVQLVMSQCGMV